MRETPKPENQKHYPGLDGLRAIAVLMVLEQHYIATPYWALWGWTGVRIFFALSGFLITGILYDTRHSKHRWSVFYMRRALRIFPLYYGVLLVGISLYPLFRWALHPSLWLWPIYLQNFSRFIWPSAAVSGVLDHLISTRYTHPLFRLRYGHFWSLAIEEQFYLFWPLAVFAVKRRETLMRICAVVIVATPVARCLSALFVDYHLLDLGFEERFSFLQFDSLLIGAFFALWMRGPHPDFTRLAKQALLALGGIVVVSEILCVKLYHLPLSPAIGQPIFASVGMTCVDLWAMALVLLAIDPNTRFSHVLQNRTLRYIGTISYGFYVFHDLFHDMYDRVAAKLGLPAYRGIGSAAVALVATLIIATLSYYGFERPFLRLKRYFVAKPDTADPAQQQHRTEQSLPVHPA